jgi:hypothetical protein
MARTPESAPRDSQMCFIKHGVTYVPHYRNKNIFVGPGYPLLNQNRFTREELLTRGAKYIDKMLWPRGEHGFVDAANP